MALAGALKRSIRIRTTDLIGGGARYRIAATEDGDRADLTDAELTQLQSHFIKTVLVLLFLGEYGGYA